ncbi:hypothetical protein ACGFWI_05550 [Streptomyces sp. NPDC048434]|uniref:hypothetical protein n=1 Tax=Streptomyces sp. NPDC048434 TaxID=3365549 RepID=UPI00372373C7
MREGFSAYPGDGSNRWPAVHRPAAAPLFRPALESGGRAGSRWHWTGEDGIPVRDITEGIGRRPGLPVESVSHEQAADRFGRPASVQTQPGGPSSARAAAAVARLASTRAKQGKYEP